MQYRTVVCYATPFFPRLSPSPRRRSEAPSSPFLRVALIEQAILGRRFFDVMQSVADRVADGGIARRDPPTLTPEKETELNLIGTGLIAKAKGQEIPFQPTASVESWPAVADSYLNTFKAVAPRLGRSFQKELRDVLSSSDDEESRKSPSG